jgi:hypothetical protein
MITFPVLDPKADGWGVVTCLPQADKFGVLAKGVLTYQWGNDFLRKGLQVMIWSFSCSSWNPKAGQCTLVMFLLEGFGSCCSGQWRRRGSPGEERNNSIGRQERVTFLSANTLTLFSEIGLRR